MRDSDRIPMVLAGFEASGERSQINDWSSFSTRSSPQTASVGMTRCPALFGLEDAELLRWLGAESDAKQHYIEDEPLKRQVGWREWMQDYREHREAQEDES